MKTSTLSVCRLFRTVHGWAAMLSAGLGLVLLTGPVQAQAPTVTTAVTPSSGLFGGGSEVNVGTNPVRVALGDVDKDGDLDLFTVNSSGTVSIRLNTGASPNFSTGPDVSVGGSPQGLALGDVDGDGDLDFVTANNVNGNGLSVELNNGNNTFTTGPNGVVAYNLNSVALGDVDGDGDLDLATGGTETTGVGVLLNNGRGVFSLGSSVGTVPGNQEVTFGDVDQDGDLDLLVATFAMGSRTVSVRLNNGAGTFGGGQNVAVGSDPRGLAVGDLDGDGDLDLVTASGYDNTASVRLNDGKGTFGGGQEVVIGSEPQSVVIGDVDGDGDLDFIVANSGGYVTGSPGGTTASVCLNNGNGRFIYANNQQVSVGNRPYSVALGDVDGDGDLDLATANANGKSASIRLNQNQALPLPVISSLAPTTTSVGSSVVITGTDFLNVQQVTINGVVVPATALSATSLTQLTFVVPVGATTGPVVVTTTAGASNAVLLTLVPAIQVTSVQPARNAPAAPRNTAVSFTFDQPLGASATTPGALKVFSQQAGGQKAGAATVSGNTLTFTPTTSFKPGETVYATVTSAAQSAAGLPAKPQVVQFTAATAPAIGLFSAAVAVPVSSGSAAVTSGDVDGDGDLDLLTASSNFPGTVSVRLNNGTGIFSGSQEINVGNYATDIVLGDIDSDGDLDVLASNFGSRTVSVRFNNGAGIFSGTQEVGCSSAPYHIHLGDMDADGDLDLIATDGVHLNNGSGMFGAGQGVVLGNDFGVGDVDNDGDLDLLTTITGASSSVTVRLNNGAANFTPGQVLAVGSGTSAFVALGDADKDGDLDLFSFTNFGSTVSVRLNDGTGTFSSGQDIAIPNPTSLVVGDVDGDGDLDVVSNGVYLNDGSGRFGSNQQAGVNGTSALGDLDGDGDLDLLAVSSGQVNVRLNQVPFAVTSISPPRNALTAPVNTPVTVSFNQPLSTSAATQGALRVFSQQAGGKKAGVVAVSGNTLALTPAAGFKPGETVQATLTRAVQSSAGESPVAAQVFQFTTATTPSSGVFSGGSEVSVGSNPVAVVVGDVDGDGDLDLLTGTYNSSASVSLRRNNGNGTFSGSQELTLGVRQPTGVLTLGDVDGDGDLDLLAAGIFNGNPVVHVRLNDGTGSFSGTQELIISGIPSSLTLGDVDGDGDLDLVTGNNIARTVSVRLNNGAGTFSGSQDIRSGVGMEAVSLVAVVLGDVDSDGDLDLLTNSGVYLNNGSGIFGTSALPVAINPRSIATGDLDGDGDLDLLAASFNDNFVNVRLNNGTGTFSGGSNVAVGTRPQGIVTADVDGDGDLDVLVAVSNAVKVLLNDGKGGFTTGQEVAAGAASTTATVAAADVDGDGDLDLLTTNAGTNQVSVRLNGYHVLATGTAALTAPLSIYPNPTRGSFTLRCASPGAQTATLLLTDQLGRQVYQQAVALQSGPNQVSVSAPDLAAGLYQLTLRLADGQRLSQKLLVQP